METHHDTAVPDGVSPARFEVCCEAGRERESEEETVREGGRAPVRESGSAPELGGVLRAAGAAAPCEAFSARDHGILLTADTAHLHNCFAQGRLQN